MGGSYAEWPVGAISSTVGRGGIACWRRAVALQLTRHLIGGAKLRSLQDLF